MKRSLIAVVAGAVVLAGMAAAPSHAVSDAAQPKWLRIDVDELSVMYEGRPLSDDEVDARTNGSGEEPLFIVYDPVSALDGKAHAFDSVAAADAWVVANDVTEASKDLPASRGTTAPDAVSSPAVALAAAPSACPSTLNHQSKIFNNPNCGGSYLALFRVDAEPSFASRSFANKGNEILIGTSTCIIVVDLFLGPSYQLGAARYIGDDNSVVWYDFPKAHTDNYESGKSSCA